MRSAYAVTLATAALACGGAAPAPDPQGAQAVAPPEAEAPVALNPDIPIAYPPRLFEQRIEGDVVLRLFVDSTGRLIPESTRVAESSDYPALDSAALAGSARLRFAPAKRHGVAVATAFLQSVEFRHPGTTGAAPPPAATPRTPPAVSLPAPQPVAPTPSPPPPQGAAPRQLFRLPSDTAKRPVDTLRPPGDTTKDTTRAVRDTSGSPPTH